MELRVFNQVQGIYQWLLPSVYFVRVGCLTVFARLSIANAFAFRAPLMVD
jgi:hypothetical protein